MKSFVKLGWVAMILLQTSCSSLSYVDYHIPAHFHLTVQRTLPVQVVKWQTDVLKADLLKVREHCHWGTSGTCHSRVRSRTETHGIMIDALMEAMQRAFRRFGLLNESHTDPKITIRATFRELSGNEVLFWANAKAVIRYQFIHENKVFYETEIATSDTVFDVSFMLGSARQHDAFNHAVQKNLMAILQHLNQEENQSAFFSGSLKNHSP